MRFANLLPVARLFLLVLLAAGTGCADGLSPAVDLAGAYEATTFLATEGGQTIDVLELGGDLEITLHGDGTTTGLFFVPGGDEDGGDFAADLAGTWTTTGDRVAFSHAADTFLRDVTWRVQGDDLVTSDFGLQVVLSRR